MPSVKRFLLVFEAYRERCETLVFVAAFVCATGFFMALLDDHKPPKVSRVTGNFHRIARDLDRALALAGLSRNQTLLLQRARELSWGWRPKNENQEALPFRLNLSELARIANCQRPGMSLQFKMMVERRFFVAVGDGTFLINKDYRKWLNNDGRSLLTDANIAWCLEALEKLAPVQPDGHPPVQPDGHPLSSQMDTPCPARWTPPVQPDGHPLSSQLDSRMIGSRGETLKDKTRQEETAERAPAPAHAYEGEPTAGRTPEDQALVEQARRLLAGNLLTEAIAMQIGRTADLPECRATEGWRYLRAAEKLLDPGTPHDRRSKWNYYLGILRSLTEDEREPRPRSDRNGRPETKPVPRLPDLPRADPTFAARLKPPTKKA
jgi:hypothetical protein